MDTLVEYLYTQPEAHSKKGFESYSKGFRIYSKALRATQEKVLRGKLVQPPVMDAAFLRPFRCMVSTSPTTTSRGARFRCTWQLL